MPGLKNTVSTTTTIFNYTSTLANNTTEEPSGSPPLIWDLSGSGQRDLFANFELLGRWAATPSGSGFLRIWLLGSIDPAGSNYPDGSASFTPLIPSTLNFPIAALTTDQRIGLNTRLQLAPTKYKVVVRNEAGSAVANAINLQLRAMTWNVDQV